MSKLPSPAMVVALVALGVALGGSAVAGTDAISNGPTAAQFASLKAQVAQLQAFDKYCLQLQGVDLTENADGVMVWGIGAPTTHAARFYALPSTAVPKPYCY